MNYDPNHEYKFTDENGNSFTSKGDNGYVWQAVTEGIPISVNQNGDWYTEPYIEANGNNVIAHVPDWFKQTSEYETWQTYASQITNMSLTQENLSNLNSVLKGLGAQGALRTSLKSDIASYGVTDTTLQNKYVDDIVNMAAEGQGQGNATINIFGTEYSSAADIARHYSDLSKEDLSRAMTSIYDIMKQGQSGTWSGTQDDLASAVTVGKVLNYIDDNYTNFGNDNEFSELLKSSPMQRFQRGITEGMATFTNNNILGLPARLAILILSGGEQTASEMYSENLSKLPIYGANLEGNEAADAVGIWGGTIANVAVTMALSAVGGKAITGSVSAAAPGSFLASVGTFMQTLPGAAVTDFFMNDLPIDLFMAANDVSRYTRDGADFGEAVSKAWYNENESQPLFGLPGLRKADDGFYYPSGVGPDVPNGLATNMLGDAIIDAALPILSIAGNSMYKQLDAATSGGITRMRERVAVENLKIQQKLTNIPILGTTWQKFVNHIMGAENANFIREARKAAIAEGSMEPYVRAQNILTLANHAGAEFVQPLYMKLQEDLGISDALKAIRDNSSKYGGYGETKATWSEIKDGATVEMSKVVPDSIPKDLKQTLLDYERLGELKGEVEGEGGLLANPSRDKEIATLERRLEKAPQELKDFAEKFSELNKQVEAMGVELGITTQEWIDALNADPRAQNYMTRQALTVGGQGIAPGKNAPDAKILTAKRKGYYAENYIDPTLALSMKVEAMGRAFAWNERAKALVAFEISQGKVVAGKGSVEIATRLAEVKQQLRQGTEFRKNSGYDLATGKLGTDVDSITAAFRNINQLLNSPEKLSLQSVYEATQNPRIKAMVQEFGQGEWKFADGVVEAAGLSDSDAAAIVRNTYSLDEKAKIGGASKVEGAEGIKSEIELPPMGEWGGVDVPDNVIDYASKVETSSKVTAGVTDDGRAFSYTVDPETKTITGFKEITDVEGMADTINKLGGVYHITSETVGEIGMSNARAINRTILFYRDNMPNLPVGPTYKMAPGGSGTLGWMYSPGGGPGYNLKVVDGHVVAEEYDVFLATRFFKKGNEDYLNTTQREMANSGHSPRNSNAPENTPIHETGHITMARLAVLEINRKIDEGVLTIPEGISQLELNKMVLQQWESVHELLAKNAIESMGLKFTEAEWHRQALTISGYAGTYGRGGKTYHYETFSEAMVDYWANGANASPFSLAIVEQVKKMSERYTVAAAPELVLKKNGLEVPKGMFEKEQYAFPDNVKTDKQRAKWLDEWRQKNPYLTDKAFTTDQYQKANLWDTYFQKEARAFDPDSKTKMPDLLAAKNGDFLADLSANAAKKMVEEIKAKSVEGFDSDLATMILSRNSNDVTNALDEFIIGRIDRAAEEIAANLPGGKTEENLNTARLTLWSDDNVKNEMTRMVNTLTPGSGMTDITSKLNELFDIQAKGLAAFEALPVDTKKLFAQQKELGERLYKENNYAKKAGKKADDALSDYRGEVTKVIHYKESGEDVYVVVNDPVVASILKNPNNFKETGVAVEALANAANFIARTYRLGTTGASPLTFVRNILRDPMQATIQGGFNPLNMSLSPEVFFHTLRQYGLDDATIKTVSDRLRTWAGSSTLTAEMRSMGIESPSNIGYRNKAEKVAKELNKIGDSKIIKAAEAPLEAWESMFRNQIAQQSFIKNFERTRDVNKAMASAMFDASNSTTNFSHSVGLFKRATSTIPYLSSAINGTASFWRQFNVDPIGMTTRITAGFMVPVMAITAWNLSSEERRKAYLNLPEWYRDSHLVLMDLEGNIVSFPIPDELSQYAGTARRLIEYSQEANQYSIPTILAQGAFGFLPVDIDGFFGEDGSVQVGQGFAQLASGLLPQAATTIYEFIAERDLFTGQDLSTYNGLNKTINTLSNIFGTGIKNVANDIGMLLGTSTKNLVGKSTADTLARDLFGMGFDNAKTQFMEMVGNKAGIDENGKETKATGLFAENETLQKQLETLNRQIAVSDDSKKEELENKKQELIDNFTNRVSNLTHKYMQLYSITGGLEEWQKNKIVQILTLGEASSSASSDSYQSADTSSAYLDERALAQQRYLRAGLPGGATLESLGKGSSIELQAAINRFYGTSKQAAQDFKNALEKTDLKSTRSEFYDAISQIYDYADANGISPDYDMIEKIQARYLQAVDAVLVPVLNQYGINILNNSDFIETVNNYVNGMIPSDDWRKSTKNAKKYLSSKEFPTATVDVKKWLMQRYSSSMKDRGLASDPEVTERLESIKADIDAGKSGSAKGKIRDLLNGINKANYYISQKDYQTLSQYNNMVK